MDGRISQEGRCAYYVIDSAHTEGTSCYRVWRRSASSPLAKLLGEYGTLDQAKESVDLDWQEGNGLVVSWGWGPDSLLPEPVAEVKQFPASAPTSAPRPQPLAGTERTG